MSLFLLCLLATLSLSQVETVLLQSYFSPPTSPGLQ